MRLCTVPVYCICSQHLIDASTAESGYRGAPGAAANSDSPFAQPAAAADVTKRRHWPYKTSSMTPRCNICEETAIPARCCPCPGV